LQSLLFDEDPIAGVRRIFHPSADGETFTIETQQDVSDLIDLNKAKFNQFDERTPWRGDLHQVGSIPMSLYFDLKKKGILDDQKALRKWWNDRDNAAFRTRPGLV
jgi:hypothetical protein